jgi:hypothetical protein
MVRNQARADTMGPNLERAERRSSSRPASPSSPTSPGPRRPISTQTPSEPSSARVDPALPSDELIQRLRIHFVHGRVAHEPRPFAAGSLVGFGRIGRAPNHGGKRVLPLRQFQPLQTQSSTRPVEVPAFRAPPGNQAVHGVQVPIDRVAVPGGLGSQPRRFGAVPGPGAVRQMNRGWALLATASPEILKVSAIAWR